MFTSPLMFHATTLPFDALMLTFVTSRPDWMLMDPRPPVCRWDTNIGGFGCGPAFFGRLPPK